MVMYAPAFTVTAQTRVCAPAETLADGSRYNVMAAASGGTVSVGTPVLSGCY